MVGCIDMTQPVLKKHSLQKRCEAIFFCYGEKTGLFKVALKLLSDNDNTETKGVV